MMSPPALPVAGATSTAADTVKVLAFHGITYSHPGLMDPAIMPEYVRQVRENHIAILRYATLDPELPRWAFLRKGPSDKKWDLLGPLTQAYSRPTGREKSMVFNDQTQQWEKAPEPVGTPAPGKEESTEKQEKTEKVAKLKRRSETEGEEPQAKKGSITSGSEVVKPVELKPATSVSTAVPSKRDKNVQEARTTTVESEKRPHTPRSGIVLKKAEEVQQHDAGEKAPHGQSSDEADDVELADRLQKASSVAGIYAIIDCAQCRSREIDQARQGWCTLQSSFCTRALVVLEPKGHWSTSTCYRLLAQGRNVASLDTPPSRACGVSIHIEKSKLGIPTHIPQSQLNSARFLASRDHNVAIDLVL